MSAKLIVLCLTVAAVSAGPVNPGYTYSEGISGTTGFDASGSVNYNTQYQPNVVSTVQRTTYTQPQTTGTFNYVQTQPQQSFNYVNQPSASAHHVSQTLSTYQNHGANYHGSTGLGNSGLFTSQGTSYQDTPSILINAANVGVPFVKTSSGSHVVTESSEADFSHPIITKNFYTFSGPEEHDEKTAVHHITVGRPQKNYRVIFIKNPSSSANRALIKAHIAPTEEKTVVYVLSKNENDLKIESEIDQPAPTQPSKPEVVFVKYKTPEEIHHLQETVQTQYNVLGGVNQVSDEGYAPVRSVIGALGQGEEITATQFVNGGSSNYNGGNVGIVTGSTGTQFVNGGSSTYNSGNVGIVTGSTGVSGLHTKVVGGGNTAYTGYTGNIQVPGSTYVETHSTKTVGPTTQTYLPPAGAASVISSHVLTDVDKNLELSRIIRKTAEIKAEAAKVLDEKVEEDVKVEKTEEKATK